MTTQTGFADVNGTRLYYEVTGSGHPLVLIHGFTLDTRMWDDQFDLFGEDYQVIRYDMRGFGKSALPTGAAYTHYDDLKALLDHLGIASVYVAGLSLGGAVAVDFTLAYPQRVAALIPVDTSALSGYSWPETVSAMLSGVWSTTQQDGIPAGKAAWLGLEWFTPAREKPAVSKRLAQIVAD
ncbi:MAG: alpha/beta fold hydrolase [Chloroflexota bacterium]